MKFQRSLIASAAIVALLTIAPQTASADGYENDPVGLFGNNGRYWIPRNGEGKGVIKLNRDGSAQMVWEGEPYHGTWEQSGDRVKTSWQGDVPFTAPSWRVRENSDPDKQYTATSSKP